MPSDQPRMAELEFEVSRETMFNLSQGGSGPCLRVRYRPAGQRRWTSFLLTGPDVSDDDMPRVGLEAAREHLAARLDRA